MKTKKVVMAVALLVLSVGALGGLLETRSARAQNVPCNIDQGGAQINFDSGCTWTMAGTTVGATASELNASSDQSTWAVLDPAADDSLTLVEHGGYPSKAVLLSTAAGDTFTLPAASGTGAVYTVIVSTTVTSNNHIVQVANATDEFYGTIYQIDADTSDTIAAYPCLDADGFDTITLNGSTKGGIKGDMLKFTDVAAGQWQVEGTVTATGTVVSMLSAAVS